MQKILLHNNEIKKSEEKIISSRWVIKSFQEKCLTEKSENLKLLNQLDYF